MYAGMGILCKVSQKIHQRMLFHKRAQRRARSLVMCGVKDASITTEFNGGSPPYATAGGVRCGYRIGLIIIHGLMWP